MHKSQWGNYKKKLQHRRIPGDWIFSCIIKGFQTMFLAILTDSQVQSKSAKKTEFRNFKLIEFAKVINFFMVISCWLIDKKNFKYFANSMQQFDKVQWFPGLGIFVQTYQLIVEILSEFDFSEMTNTRWPQNWLKIVAQFKLLKCLKWKDL